RADAAARHARRARLRVVAPAAPSRRTGSPRMNQKTLIGLGIAAIVAIGAAVALNHSNRPQSGQAEASAYLVPELREHINDVTKVVVTGAEGKVAATLERGANDWTLAEKGGYPADTGKLR